MKAIWSSQGSGLQSAAWQEEIRPRAVLGFLAVALASVLVGVAGAQTVPTGYISDANVPAVAAGTSSATATYLLNRDESVSYLQQGGIVLAGCAALDTTTFKAATGLEQNLIYDSTANLLYIMSPLSNNDTGIVSETPDPAGNCNPSVAVDLPGGLNYSQTMASDAAESNLYVVDSHQGVSFDVLYVLNTGSFASYPPAGSTAVPSYELDYSATYGTLVVDPSSHLVYIPETVGGPGDLTGPGFWVFDPTQNKIVRVLGYVDPSTSNEVNIDCVRILIAGNGKIVVVNQNPNPGTTLETTVLYEFDTTQFSFFSGTAAGTGSPSGVYIKPPSNAIKVFTATSSYSSISAADIDVTDGLVYVAAYNENSSNKIAQTGLLLSYNLADSTGAETAFDSSMAQPTTNVLTTYTTWEQLTFDAYANEVLLYNLYAETGTMAISTSLSGGSAQVNTITATSFNPLGVAYSANSGYIYAPSVLTPGTPSDPTVYYFQPATISPTATLSSTVTFPSTTQGSTSAPLTATLMNTSTVTLSNISISITGGQMSDFALTTGTGSCGTTLAAGASCSVYVTFTPSGGGSFSATLQVTDSASNSPQMVSLTGTGVAPVTVAPSGLTFNSQAVGTTSAAQTVRLTNQGSGALSITGVSFSGTNPGDFAQGASGTCGAYLVAESSCTIAVTFTPAATGARTATLNVADSASNSPQMVSLTGTGVAPVTVAPSGLTFNSQAVGTTSAAQTVTLTNQGSGALSITGVSFSGTNPGDFAQGASGTCGAYLVAESSCTIAVTFTPAATGARTATLNVADSASNSPQMVSLTGTGVAPVTVAPSGLTFNSQAVGTTSAAQTVTLTNQGSGALSITGVSFSGTNPGDFAQGASGTCGAYLVAESSCTIAVTFTPAATGARTATLNVADSASNSPQMVSLTGTGVAPVTVAPSGLTFNSQAVGTTSAAQTVTLTNQGSGALSITGVSFSGTNPGDFAQGASGTCGAYLVAESSCTIAVTFTPAATGARTATLNVADSASNSPQMVSLTGTGVAPVTPSVSCNIPTVPLSGDSGSVQITCTATDFTGTIALECNLPASLSSYITCSFSPSSLNFASSSTAITTLTIQPVKSTSASLERRSRPWGGASGGVALGALLWLPTWAFVMRRKKGRSKRGLLLMLILLCGLPMITSCGGKSGPATAPPGTYQASVVLDGPGLDETLTFTIQVP